MSTAHRAGYFLLTIMALLYLAMPLLSQQMQPASPELHATSSVNQEIDPDKPSSELNHHLAGYALIVIGAAAIWGHLRKQPQIEKITPILFILIGLFLAFWSDSEIWPRGSLGWGWLIHHDPEARQHKIFALILILIGIVEYLRIEDRLGLFLARYAFPALAIFGGVFLFFHHHGGTPSSSNARGMTVLAEAQLPMNNVSGISSDAEMHHHHSAMDAGHDSHMEHSPGMMHMLGHEHQHMMTPAMLKIANEHMWFSVVGFAIALTKFLYDAFPSRRRFVPYMWPSLTVVLGILLSVYSE